MHDHETVTAVAAEIITWQAAAQHLPLPDLRAILATSLDHLAEVGLDRRGNKPVAACAALGDYCVASDWCRWCTRGAAGHRHGFHDPFGEVHCQFCGSGGCPGRA